VATHPEWLEVRTVSVPLDASLAFLDVGEREAIHLATELEADALIIDEPAGREAAKQQGLRVIGTLRVLYDAAEAGLCNLDLPIRCTKSPKASFPRGLSFGSTVF